MAISTQFWTERRHGISVLCRSATVRGSISNSAYSVAEYFAQPAGMFLAAPFLVRHLGIQQFGIWMLVNALLSSLGILSSGFGDATVKYVSAYRGRGDVNAVIRTIRASSTINTLLAGSLALLMWTAAPLAVERIFKIEPALQLASMHTLRIAAVIMVIRSAESVFISTLRAYERYGSTVKVTVLSRTAIVLSAVSLAWRGGGVVSIMGVTLCMAAFGLAAQAVAVRATVPAFSFVPLFDKATLGEIARFGCFSWMQALAAVVFSYADRLLLGAFVGPAAVAYYTLCAQAAQPIHGLTAAALNFLFPHISSRYEAGELLATRRIFRVALWINFAAVAVLSLPLILFAKPILTLWMGAAFAAEAHTVLSTLALAYALLALNVVCHYTLLALGKVRLVSMVNIAGGAASIIAAAILIPSMGIVGASLSRLFYGPITAIVIWKTIGSFPLRVRATVLERASQ